VIEVYQLMRLRGKVRVLQALVRVNQLLDNGLLLNRDVVTDLVFKTVPRKADKDERRFVKRRFFFPIQAAILVIRTAHFYKDVVHAGVATIGALEELHLFLIRTGHTGRHDCDGRVSYN